MKETPALRGPLLWGVILMGALAVQTLQAQPGRTFFPWWDSPLVKDLNLTEDQQRRIQAITREFRSRLIDARAATEKAEGELEDAFNEDPVDVRKAEEAIERLAAARAELTRIYSLMSLRLRSVLTAQQWSELRRRRPGPGLRPEERGPRFRGRPGRQEGGGPPPGQPN